MRSGDTIASPPVRQSFTFLATAEETGGEVLRFDARLGPGSFMPPHVHRRQEERFDVLEGEGEFLVGRRRRRVGPGDTLTVPARRAHAFRTLGGSARLIAELRPALDTEELFAALFALGRAGRVNRFGAPGPRKVATLMHRHPDAFFFLPVIPPAAQLALARPLAAPAVP
jgi:quercetin dioxygenase-like cupin family protein